MGRGRMSGVALTVAMILAMTAPAAAAPPADRPAKAQRVESKATPQVVADLVVNTCVTIAIDAEYKGRADILIRPPSNDIVLRFSASNLLPGNYLLYLDRDGAPPGPLSHLVIGVFTVGDNGKGAVEVVWPSGSPLPGDDGSGTFNWDFYLDVFDPDYCGAETNNLGSYSVLGTESDLMFTID